MKRSRLILRALVTLGGGVFLGGCLVDLYGGEPQIQIQVDSHRWMLESEGLGDTASPVWTVAFAPPIGAGAVTQVENLPVAGDLHLFLRLTDTLGRDTVVRDQLHAGVGEFQRLVLEDDTGGGVRIR